MFPPSLGLANVAHLYSTFGTTEQIIPGINHFEGFQKHILTGDVGAVFDHTAKTASSLMSLDKAQIFVFENFWRELGVHIHMLLGKTQEQAAQIVEEELRADAENRQKVAAAKQSREEKKTVRVCTFSAEGCITTAKTVNCGRCKFAKYCSKDCQTTHWPEHRKVCVASSSSSSSA